MKKRSLNFLRKIFDYIIALILLSHWILLVQDRIVNQIPLNLFWLSHLALLITSLGLFFRNGLLLTTALVSILVLHGLWIIDFIFLLLGNSPSGYTEYFLRLTFYRMFLTSHHIYLIPLLIFTLRKKINNNGWILASILFAILSILSFLFLPKEFNINCAHYVCKPLQDIFPFLEISFSGFIYLIILNIFVDLFLFYLPNKFLVFIFKK